MKAMKAFEQVVQLLSVTDPDIRIESSYIWDLLPASRGLTVLLRNGTFLPLVLPEGTAKQILHVLSVESVR